MNNLRWPSPCAFSLQRSRRCCLKASSISLAVTKKNQVCVMFLSLEIFKDRPRKRTLEIDTAWRQFRRRCVLNLRGWRKSRRGWELCLRNMEQALWTVIFAHSCSPSYGAVGGTTLKVDRLSPKYAHNLKLYWNLKKEQGRGTRELTTHSNSRVSN
jgi:hypothetical protein